MDMNTKHVNPTRLLPKTGQIESWADYDDGYYQVGWWKGRTVADNKTRFVARTIGNDDVVIDNATGLMWVADGDSAGGNLGVPINWANSLIASEDLTFAGFTDWRLPNIKELASIIDYAHGAPPFDTAFFTVAGASGQYWSSTSLFGKETDGFTVTSTGEIEVATKTYTLFIFCVRGGL